MRPQPQPPLQPAPPHKHGPLRRHGHRVPPPCRYPHGPRASPITRPIKRFHCCCCGGNPCRVIVVTVVEDGRRSGISTEGEDGLGGGSGDRRSCSRRTSSSRGRRAYRPKRRALLPMVVNAVSPVRGHRRRHAESFGGAWRGRRRAL